MEYQQGHLRFEIKMAKNPSARRELLLMISIIYDSLGLKAPFLLEAGGEIDHSTVVER